MAMQKVVVGGSSVSASQLKDLFRQIEDRSIDGHHIQALLERRNPFAGPSMELSAQLERWQARFDNAGITCDTSKVAIPEQQPGIDRLIINPQGLMPNRTITCMRERFKVWTYIDDLDKAIAKNDRSNEDGAYAVWVRDDIEADEEHKNMSANQIAEQGIAGQTLLERLLHEWVYFDETGKHLDIKNRTLCTGSRGADGRVPRVCWRPDRGVVSVHCYYPDDSHSRLRARAVVSLPAEASAQAG